MLVVAGPGSGKTTVITHRILHLIRQEHILPGNILVITYTKAAANEMKSRFLSLTGKAAGEVTFGTFHAVFYQILRYSYRFQEETIISEAQQIAIIQEQCRIYGITAADQDLFHVNMLSAISKVKNGLSAPEAAAPHGCRTDQFVSVLRGYQSCLSEYRYLDFDDLQIYCRNLLQKRPDVLAKWQNKYQYILVDEFQDCSPMQYDLVRMLAAPRNNLFLVGDDDQSIYSFRGASPMLMQQFLKDYPAAQQVTLRANYRCHPDIIEASGRLIEHNRFRLPKKMSFAAGAAHEGGPAVFEKQHRDQRSEVMFIRQQIRALTESGLAYRDMAVLTRTNTQLSYFQEMLEAEGVPCVCKEAQPGIYRHWITKDVMAYFQIAAGSRDRALLLRIMNRPNRYLSRKMLPDDPVSFTAWQRHYVSQEWIGKRVKKLADDVSVMGRMRPFAALTYLLKAVGYEEWMISYAESRGLETDRLTEVLEVLAERTKKYDSIAAWLEAAGRAEAQSASDSRSKEDADGVRLMTYHAAKGLEFHTVFLPDLCEGIVPYHRAVFSEEVEEERRMLYVAMTRAKEKLFLMTADEIRNHQKEPSCFLPEIRRDPL